MLINCKGDLFESGSVAIGHGVNCRGVMGAGIAKSFKAKFPQMYESYRKLCSYGLLKPGDIYPWYESSSQLIINVASQDFPGNDAKLDHLYNGIRKALEYCDMQNTPTLAIPRIGCGIGGLLWADVHDVLTLAASQYSTNLYVWEY